ncbi:bifunctional metallophosphatase/5'-nucleotidase [Alkalihalobacillus sp. 1P02AB]|uniref:bifunctional metallophosphatase/5'-nucleotidase n=1 Tax=Alkalihalobacillus sp. 1P02AB TaxID=3132260 RepID=UPI0039A64579
MTTEKLTIFHVNDLHSCFTNWPHIVGYVNQHRDESTLFLDLGDHADRSQLITEATEGKGNVELLNQAKIDYATIGNNEGVTFSKPQLDRLYEQATFPVLVGNLFEKDGSLPKWAQPYAIHTFENGVRIGLIGWTAAFTGLYSQLGWKNEDSLEPLKEIVQQLKKETDIVILMSHLGLFTDEEIAAQMDGIDFIFGSHTHHVLAKGKWVAGTLITQAGKHGHYFGQLEVEYDLEKGKIFRAEEKMVAAIDCEPSQETRVLIEQLEAEAFQKLNQRVATIPHDLLVSWQDNTEVIQMLCDALAKWCKEEMAMLNAGVLLESIRQGEITKGDIHRICPHPINPCVVELTGSQLKATIERAFTNEIRYLELKGFGFRGKILGRMIFTGISISLSESEQVSGIEVLGEPLQLEETYRLATLDMYTFGHLFPDIFQAPNKEYFMPEFLRDILAWKLGQEWA